jgi:hypothetical protein
MPEYLYKHPQTQEIKAVFQGMQDKHEFIDQDGTAWKRVFTSTTFSLDSSNVDPFSADQFVEKTKNMKGTYGDMLDYSKELSQRREETLGKEDPLKRKVFDNYKKERGINHVNDRPKSKGLDTPDYKVEF